MEEYQKQTCDNLCRIYASGLRARVKNCKFRHRLESCKVNNGESFRTQVRKKVTGFL